MNECKYCGKLHNESGDLCPTCDLFFQVVDDPESYTSVRVRVNYDYHQ